MSKYELQELTHDASGISYSESTLALELSPNMYERWGAEGWMLLSKLFYDRVFADTAAPWFKSIFASSTKEEAINNQYRFFVQTFGGPDLYRQAKGQKHTRLVGRHANYAIGHRAAERWIHHMEAALDDHPLLQPSSQRDNKQVKHALRCYFRYTAHYIVVASEYMRSDQLSGGTSVDPGRVW
jgi:truncated hemoglobin YjbI